MKKKKSQNENLSVEQHWGMITEEYLPSRHIVKRYLRFDLEMKTNPPFGSKF